MVEGVERIEASCEHHRQTCGFQRLKQCRSFANDKDYSVRLVQLFEDGNPLFELIELGAAITEIDGDFTSGVATIEFVFETVPPLGASDPLARSLPSS